MRQSDLTTLWLVGISITAVAVIICVGFFTDTSAADVLKLSTFFAVLASFVCGILLTNLFTSLVMQRLDREAVEGRRRQTSAEEQVTASFQQRLQESASREAELRQHLADSHTQRFADLVRHETALQAQLMDMQTQSLDDFRRRENDLSQMLKKTLESADSDLRGQIRVLNERLDKKDKD